MDRWENPFDNPDIARGYEHWFKTPEGNRIDEEEKELIRRMTPSGEGKSLLDVGAGTGHFSRFMTGLGYRVVGIDPSPVMLDEAKKRGPVRYVMGDALCLPYPDRSFDVVSAFTSLEFVPDPRLAISEMIRVSRGFIFIAFLNQLGAMNILRRIKNLSGNKDVYSDISFFPFTVGGMKKIVNEISDEMGRRADIQWGSAIGPLLISSIFSRNCFGSFAYFLVSLSG